MASIVYLALWSCFRIYCCAIQRPSTDNHIWMLTLTLHWLVLKVKKKVSSLSTHDHLYSRPCCSYLPFPLLLCYHCFWDFHLLFSLHLLFLVLANFTLFSFGFCSLVSFFLYPLPLFSHWIQYHFFSSPHFFLSTLSQSFSFFPK